MIKPGIVAIAILAVILQFTPAGPAYASDGWYPNCQKESVTSFWEEPIFGHELKGRGTICTTPFGLWSTLSIKGLTEGNAYTVWWVYIDDPASCVNFPLGPPDVPFPEPQGYAGPCGLADFFTPDSGGDFLNPLAVFGRMDSVVASHRHRTRFAGDLRGFTPASGSQVWMFVFGHGPADQSDKRQLARQMLTPEDPTAGAPHLGIEGSPYGYPAGVVVVDIP